MPASDLSTPARALAENSPCAHMSVDIRSCPCSNGTTQFFKQCLIYGEKVGTAIKHAEVIAARGRLDLIAPFDDALREAARERQRAARQIEREAQMLAKDAERAAFAEWYSDYLKSVKWRAKRRRVLDRADGICEGCRDATASEVHHLTYANVGDELLFELVALFGECHERAHGRSS